MHKIALLVLLAALPAVCGMGDFFYGFGTYGQVDGEFVTDTIDSSVTCTTVADADSGDRCDSIISWRNGTRYRVVYPDTQITYTITSDVIDSVFFSRTDVTDSFTVTGTDVGNGSHAFLPANDSIAESGRTVRVYPIPDAGNAFSGFSGDTAGGVRVGDTLTVIMSANRAITLTFTAIPVIDSIRKNPNYRNDSSSIYLRGGSSAGIVRNLTTGTNVLQKYWSDTRIDVYTGNWSRGWHQIRVTTEDSLRDTASLYIAIPRKTN